MAYPTVVFSLFSFVGFLLCVIPLPWHLQAWNTGTCLFMFWTAIGCLNYFINSIIWNGNAINWAPVWCDISTRIIVGCSFGLPAAALCINRRLYHISSVRMVTITKADKRRGVMVDLAIGVGLPILGMILQYIPQGHRFNIFEDIGCFPFTYYVWPAYPLVILPPIIITLISCVYATLTIITFRKNRSQFNAMMSSHNSMTSSRYIRLMCIGSVEVFFSLPINITLLALEIRHSPLNPWISWANVHSGFSRVDQIPTVFWRSSPIVEAGMELSRWTIVFCAFIFFFFFGFADEAKKNYRFAFESVAKRVGISTSSFSSGSSSNFLSSTGSKSKAVGSSGKVRPILPVFVHRELLQRHDSLDSFTDISVSVGGPSNEKTFSEKEDFSPTVSYGGLSIADVGGALSDSKDDYLTPPKSPASSSSSSASSISYPAPVLTRKDSKNSIDISSAHRDSVYLEHSTSLPVPTSNSSQS